MDISRLTDLELACRIEGLYARKMCLEVGGVFSFGGREELNAIDRAWNEATAERRRREMADAAE